MKGDQVDAYVAEIQNNNKFSMPVIRIGPGKYLLGTESKMLMIKGDICMVRVGGGFVSLQEYIERYQD